MMQNRVLLGVSCLCAGVLVFSLQDPLIKAVSGAYPVTQVMAVRSIVALPILLAIVHLEVGLARYLLQPLGPADAARHHPVRVLHRLLPGDRRTAAGQTR